MPGPALSVSIPHRPPNVTANANANANANDSHSRSSSVNSHSPSIQSAANSTRYMLAGMNNNSSGLDPPTLPYGSRSGSYRSMSPKNDTPLMGGGDTKGTSLSVNYLPSKFSANILAGGMKRRKGKGDGPIPIPKTGGGREAFRANESRMPGDGDDDYDGVSFGQARKGRLRWNRFKWVLFIANLVVSPFPPSSLLVPPLHLRPLFPRLSRACLCTRISFYARRLPRTGENLLGDDPAVCDVVALTGAFCVLFSVTGHISFMVPPRHRAYSLLLGPLHAGRVPRSLLSRII